MKLTHAEQKGIQLTTYLMLKHFNATCIHELCYLFLISAVLAASIIFSQDFHHLILIFIGISSTYQSATLFRYISDYNSRSISTSAYISMYLSSVYNIYLLLLSLISTQVHYIAFVLRLIKRR